MAFAYFEHDADVGVVGRGKTITQAFAAAAQAVFAIVTDLDAIHSDDELVIEFEESDLELALVVMLNLILGKSRELGMVFNDFHVHHKGDQWQVRMSGEKWHAGLQRGVEVKGATLTMLSVKQSDGMWEARCVVDV